jgi:hypothetical protein
MTASNDQDRDSAAAPRDPLDPRASGAAPGEVDSRSRRIDDLLKEALAKKCPLEANLGVVNSDLMRLEYGLNQLIVKAMAQPAALEHMSHLMPALDSFLRVVKQIERYAQLDRRLVAAREKMPSSPGPGAPHGLKLTPLPPAKPGEDWPS